MGRLQIPSLTPCLPPPALPHAPAACSESWLQLWPVQTPLVPSLSYAQLLFLMPLGEPGGHAECSVSLWPLLPPPDAQPTFAHRAEVAGVMG